jgi:MFS family permease
MAVKMPKTTNIGNADTGELLTQSVLLLRHLDNFSLAPKLPAKSIIEELQMNDAAKPDNLATHNTERPLGRQDYKTLGLSALGGTLEFYDFIIFVYFATVIGNLFFPPGISDWLRQLQTFGIFAAGYLARPLGGIIMAHFGDLIGRKKMFTLSILLMALPTLAMGLLPTYETIGLWAPVALLFLRILQGAAIGGEVPGAWVFVSEHVPARRVGFACGTLTAGLTGGILLGSLITTVINTVFSPTEVVGWAWRIPFLLGGIFGFVAMYLRQWLHETPVFLEMQQNKALAQEVPLKAVLRDHSRAVVLSVIMSWMLSAAIVVVVLMTPTFLQKLYGFSAHDALTANSVATLCLTFGCLLAGSMADRFGARQVLMVGCLLLGSSTYLLYTSIHDNPGLLLPLYALAGFTVGTVGAVPAIMVKAFPASVRFTGISFSYNVAYAVFGGMTPIIVTLMLKHDPLAPAHYVVAVCALSVVTALLSRKN